MALQYTERSQARVATVLLEAVVYPGIFDRGCIILWDCSGVWVRGVVRAECAHARLEAELGEWCREGVTPSCHGGWRYNPQKIIINRTHT